MSQQHLLIATARQRLLLLPDHGAGIAGWEVRAGDRWQPILRPWNGVGFDRYQFAGFPLVPWSNRISGGGFTQDGIFHPVRPNRIGEPYPIHGDGWLQPWQFIDTTVQAAAQKEAQAMPPGAQHAGGVLQLVSDRFAGDPYQYSATLQVVLDDASDAQGDVARLRLILTVTHQGDHPLPYGLGLHPYFLRNSVTRLQMQCEGVWLSGDDPLPVAHVDRLPPTFDYRQPAPLDGPLIDHCFTGWDGLATVQWPDRGLHMEMTMPDSAGYVLLYRPPHLDYFCLEPITHPIDAFHLPGRPGLRVLGHGESMTLEMMLAVRVD